MLMGKRAFLLGWLMVQILCLKEAVQITYSIYRMGNFRAALLQDRWFTRALKHGIIY